MKIVIFAIVVGMGGCIGNMNDTSNAPIAEEPTASHEAVGAEMVSPQPLMLNIAFSLANGSPAGVFHRGARGIVLSGMISTSPNEPAGPSWEQHLHLMELVAEVAFCGDQVSDEPLHAQFALDAQRTASDGVSESFGDECVRQTFTFRRASGNALVSLERGWQCPFFTIAIDDLVGDDTHVFPRVVSVRALELLDVSGLPLDGHEIIVD